MKINGVENVIVVIIAKLIILVKNESIIYLFFINTIGIIANGKYISQIIKIAIKTVETAINVMPTYQFLLGGIRVKPKINNMNVAITNMQPNQSN